MQAHVPAAEPTVSSSTARSIFDDEARELFASRLTTFVTVLFAMRAGAIALLALVQWLRDVRPRFYAVESGQVGLVGTAVVGALLLVLRARRLSERALRSIDAVLVPALAVVGAFSIGIEGSRAQSLEGPLLASTFEVHQLKVLLLFVHGLLLRAALIPSRTSRTALIGSVGAVVLATATVVAHRRLDSPLPSSVTAVGTLVWAGFSVIVSSVCSAVFSGLRKKAQKAMRMGQYTLGDKLGEGGMGTVYLARHALLRRPTAIKVLSTERVGHAALERFEREVQVTAKLSHPNIVSVYDFGRSHDGTFYYAMEFLDGVDLQQLVENDGPQHPGRVIRLLRQAAEALAEAHAVDLIHRDVKPANMILVQRAAEADVLKLVDFGLVKELVGDERVAESGVHLQGTPLYMAPEAIIDPARLGPQSDLYALGAVGYFLLTGVPVFDGRSTIAVLGSHAHLAPIPPSERIGELPKKLEALVLRCLEKDPLRRYANARELCSALDDCDDAPPWIQAQAASWWQTRRPRPASRHAASPYDRTLAIDLAARGDSS
jgi:serine/threonine-protein kinase